MQVWQHLDKSDYLLRRAESMIEAAQGATATNTTSDSRRPNARDVHMLELRAGIQEAPGLADIIVPSRL